MNSWIKFDEWNLGLENLNQIKIKTFVLFQMLWKFVSVKLKNLNDIKYAVRLLVCVLIGPNHKNNHFWFDEFN